MDAAHGAGSPSHGINNTPKRNNNPYVRNTVERAIHRHRVVIFSKNEQDRLGHILYGLFDDTPNTPFQSHEIKCYYLDELPSQHDIEQVLKRMADECSPMTSKKKISSPINKSPKTPTRLDDHHHSNNYKSPKQESRQPSLSPPSSPPATTTEVTRPRVTFSSETKGGTSIAPPTYELVSPDCYVFVNGRYLSLHDIRDFFVRLAPSSRSVQIFLEYTQRKHYLHPYNNNNKSNKMIPQSRSRPTQSYHTYPSRQHQYQQQHYQQEEHSPTTRNGTAKSGTTTYHRDGGGGDYTRSRPYSSSTYPPTTTSKHQ